MPAFFLDWTLNVDDFGVFFSLPSDSAHHPPLLQDAEKHRRQPVDVQA